jgi:parallel beta-helix repeat protein
MLATVFNIQPAMASGTIYIRADGSIEPSDAPISTIDNVTYTFTGNVINGSIVVERDNTVVDGSGYTVQGTEAYESTGIDLTERSNVTIKNINIEAFYSGILLAGSSNNSVSRNNITNNHYGIELYYSSSNNVSGNNITANNDCGIYLSFTSDNGVYHNNFVNNTGQVCSKNSTNVWDDGYPSGGNYWSDYNGADADHDGIGDTAYVIDANNTDNYPLMVPTVIPEFSSFPILPLFFIATLLTVVIYRRRHAQNE